MSETMSHFTDLSVRLGKATLTKLVLDAVQAVRASHPQLAVRPRDETLVNPWELLALLTYCYATGIYASRQIADAASTDFQLSSFCGDAIPTRDDIAWFRRHNRAVLQRCLEQVLQIARQRENELERGRELGGVAVGTWTNPGSVNPALREPVAEEASERITRAVELDCMSNDW